MQLARSAYPALVLLLGLALVVSYVFHQSGILSLVPPASASDPAPAADAVGLEFMLWLSATTAWASLILLIPVFGAVWFRNRSRTAWLIWLNFWTVSWIAYAVHIAVSGFGFFDGDFAWMTTSSRVSAFWPGMILLLWWPLDIWLARGAETGWIKTQRLAVHISTFVLFFGGSAVKGETLTVKAMGAILALGLLTAGFRYFWNKETR